MLPGNTIKDESANEQKPDEFFSLHKITKKIEDKKQFFDYSGDGFLGIDN